MLLPREKKAGKGLRGSFSYLFLSYAAPTLADVLTTTGFIGCYIRSSMYYVYCLFYDGMESEQVESESGDPLAARFVN